MIRTPSRPFRTLLAALLATSFIAPVLAEKPKTAPAAVAVPKSNVPWLYRGSDIPVDTNWAFGEIENGLRYAVRKNGVPPGQVSIRIIIDAGSMMELTHEGGFAHFNEHLSFRGSKYVSDGEAKRVWQRLGASFGSDTNAITSSTQTIYKLDLPNATETGLDETFKILSGMMTAPTMGQAEVDAERRTVLAELREGEGPGERVSNAQRKLLFGGQPLGLRSPIGTVETLSAATPQTLRGFRDRWYRPERAVIAVSGDVSTMKAEALIRKYFSSWKGVGPATPDADFGTPQDNAPKTGFVHEPGTATAVTMAWLRPWQYKDDTIAMNQGRLVDMLAASIINRRLEQRARAGGSYVAAGIDRSDYARSVNGTFITIQPVGDGWEAALADVRAALEDARTRAPTKDEIDRETAEIVAAFDVAVESTMVEPSSQQADSIGEAVNIRETVAAPDVARDVFTGLKGTVTPAQILKSTQDMFTGVGPRVFVSSKVASPDAAKRLEAALAAPVKALTIDGSKGKVTFDSLPKFGPAATVVKQTNLPGMDTRSYTLSNGVKVLMSTSPLESGRVFVSARFGNGRLALPMDRVSPAWAAGNTMVASGIASFDQNDLDAMASGRKIGMEFEIGDDSFAFNAKTRPADLDDQLKMIAAKFATPGWDAAPVRRAKSAYAAEVATLNATPQGILGREMDLLLHSGDKRWQNPTAAEADALTPEAFRAFWEPMLASGPIELSVFGDFGEAKTLETIKATFGALKPRKPLKPLGKAALVKGPKPNATAQIIRHDGNKDQAAALLAWETGGGVASVYESRVLDMLAAIFTDRLFEQFREAEGEAYSPSVFSTWSTGLPSGGSLVAYSPVKKEGAARFFTRAKAIAADLAAKPVTADELARAIAPMKETLDRAQTGRYYWMSQLAGATRDPARVPAAASWITDLERMTAADIQAVAQKYLVPGKGYALSILPKE